MTIFSEEIDKSKVKRQGENLNVGSHTDPVACDPPSSHRTGDDGDEQRRVCSGKQAGFKGQKEKAKFFFFLWTASPWVWIFKLLLLETDCGEWIASQVDGECVRREYKQTALFRALTT